eukprot:TRINITY_DN37280_c0_g1_i1.p1 TRINITY_DN37280_c0_g1~~TRINITY_DN37280_c0_g1_i1.p1  ORF type:complete len:710 (+),score=128.78 TRINITY_DN37280_c0_g1_i1:50-2131(+)
MAEDAKPAALGKPVAEDAAADGRPPVQLAPSYDSVGTHAEIHADVPPTKEAQQESCLHRRRNQKVKTVTIFSQLDSKSDEDEEESCARSPSLKLQPQRPVATTVPELSKQLLHQENALLEILQRIEDHMYDNNCQKMETQEVLSRLNQNVKDTRNAALRGRGNGAEAALAVLKSQKRNPPLNLPLYALGGAQGAAFAPTATSASYFQPGVSMASYATANKNSFESNLQVPVVSFKTNNTVAFPSVSRKLSFESHMFAKSLQPNVARQNTVDSQDPSLTKLATTFAAKAKANIAPYVEMNLQEEEADKEALAALDANERNRRKLRRLLLTGCFTTFITFIILMNIFVMGLSIELEARGFDYKNGFARVNLVFDSIYIIELIVRLVALRRKFFPPHADGWWHMFDILVVASSLFEFVGEGIDGSLLRVLRFGKIARVLRLIRFCSPLRLMIMAIWSSIKSLTWAMILLMFLLYILAIVICQGAVDFLNDSNKSAEDMKQIEEYYGTLYRVGYHLFAAVAGGISWVELVNRLRMMGTSYTGLFLLYVVFLYFALMNIITAVVVDSAMQKSQNDRHMIVEREMEMLNAVKEALLEMFKEADYDMSEELNFQEFSRKLEDERVKAYLTAIGVDVHDSKALFQTLDKDGDGNVNTTEFVDGLVALMEHAKHGCVELHHEPTEEKDGSTELQTKKLLSTE